MPPAKFRGGRVSTRTPPKRKSRLERDLSASLYVAFSEGNGPQENGKNPLGSSKGGTKTIFALCLVYVRTNCGKKGSGPGRLDQIGTSDDERKLGNLGAQFEETVASQRS